MRARVRGPIRALASSTLMVSDSSTSTSTTRAPTWVTARAVAAKVSVGTRTSCPEPMPAPRRARCRAAEPEHAATAYFTPSRAATQLSSRSTRGPLVRGPSRSTVSTAARSAAVIDGR